MGNDLGIEGLSDLTEIGVGGFATVYAGRDDVFDRRVAVKVLQSADPDALRRFRRELLLMGSLADHHHIVTPYRPGESAKGHPYVVMEYLGGGSLADVLDQRGPLPWDEAVGLIAPIADALGAAHAAGVVHLDVKPANILLNDDGVPKLTDFGIAVLQEATVTMRAFTLTHTAPETFASGEDERDHRSDLYSLASSLFQLTTGAAPYARGRTDSMEAHMVRILTFEVPSSGLGPDHDRFFAQALAKEPEDRHQTAEAFRAALVGLGPAAGGAFDGAGSGPPTSGTAETVHARHRTTPAPAPVPESVSESVPESVPIVEPEPALGRRWPLVGAIGVVLTLAATGGAWGVARLGGEAPPSTSAPPIGSDVVASATTVPVAVDDPLVLGGHVNIVNKVIPIETSEGLRLASGSSTGLIRLWDPSVNGGDPQVLEGHASSVWFLTVLGDGRLASASGDATVRIWDVDDLDAEPVVLRGHTGDVYDILELTDGRLATGGLDGSVRVWPPLDTGGDELVLGGHDGAVSSLVQLSDGRLATSGADGLIRLWDLDDPAVGTAEPVTLSGHEGQVWKMIPLSDGRLASTGDDATVRVWDPTRPEVAPVVLAGHQTRVRDIVQLPDRRIAASATDGAIRIWDPAAPATEPVVLDGHAEASQVLVLLADGRLASASVDDTVRIWDLDDSTAEPVVYEGHGDDVYTLSQLDDGRVASAGLDTDVHVWTPAPG
ncbi:MAG: serine/threonine-protein kinase [Actinomycetota bacterium]